MPAVQPKDPTALPRIDSIDTGRTDERRALFARYWHEPKETLATDEARCGWVPPDRTSLDG